MGRWFDNSGSFGTVSFRRQHLVSPRSTPFSPAHKFHANSRQFPFSRTRAARRELLTLPNDDYFDEPNRRTSEQTNQRKNDYRRSESRSNELTNGVGLIFARDADVHRNAQPGSRATTRVSPLLISSTPVSAPLNPLVLIADGDAVSRDIREAQLHTAGLRVSIARTGFEAIVKACCYTPDVILLDDSLIGIDAAETFRMLTTCPTTAHIPIVRLLRGRRLPQRMLSRLRRVAA